MRIVLLGAPGSGKGTQSGRLKEMYGISHISTGDILRSEVARGSVLGQKAASYMISGSLVPDELILEMVETRLQQPDTQRGWLMDGFPRTLVQAHGLIDVTERIGQRVDAGVILNVDAEIVVQRLSGRRVCSVCSTVTNVKESQSGTCPVCGGKLVLRPDDEPETVRHRLATYTAYAAPVIEHYRVRPSFAIVDGHQHSDQVAATMLTHIESLIANP